MSKKIVVSQKQLEEIIDCYVNKQYGLERTLKELKLPFGRNPLKRILIENNVHIRTFKEASKVAKPPYVEVTKEISNQIVDLYNQGYSINRIQQALTDYFSSDKIKSILLFNHVKLRTLEEAKKIQIETEERTYIVNDDYCLESHNGAWILGFYAADGYLPTTKGAKNRITIGLARKDEEILHLIAKEISYDGPIYQYNSSEVNGKSFPCSSLAFTSKKLRKQFEFYGVVNNKTFKIDSLPKELPQEYMIDYIRGYFDGDGSVYKPKDKKINMSITSANKNFLEDVQTFLAQKYSIDSHIYENKSAYSLKFGVDASIKLGKLMYNNDYLTLPRKKKKFFEIISPTSLDIPKE